MERMQRRALAALTSALIALPALLAPAEARAQNGHELYQQALRMERVEGDLQAAIRLYERVAASADRALAARALVRIGENYERLGRAQAAEAYRRVVREFADQTAAAELAGARLAVLEKSAGPAVARQAPAGLTVRLVWGGSEPAIDVEGRPTPDGRFLTFVDWLSGDLAVRNVTTGEQRRLTNTGYPEYALGSSVSPDGRRVAYLWTLSPWRPQLRVIGVDGTGERVLLNNAAGEVDYFMPAEWTPDGKQILVDFWMVDRTARIGLVSAEDGATRIVKSLDWRQPMRSSLSPDGRYIAYDFPADTASPRRDIYVVAVDGSRETAVIKHPANDLHPIWTPDGRHLLFSSDRGGSIDLWAVPMADGRPSGAPVVVKRDMAQNFFWPMGFTRDGALFFAKDTGGGDIMAAPFDPATGKVSGEPARIVENFVGYNTMPHLSPDGRKVVFATRHGVASLGHAASLVVHDLRTGELRKPVPGLVVNRKNSRLRWSPDGRSVLADGRDMRRRSGIYVVDPDAAAAVPVVLAEPGEPPIGEARWLPDGRSIVYDRGHRGGDRTFGVLIRHDLETGRQEEVFRHERSLRFDWSLSPDGRRIAFIDHPPGRVTRIMVKTLGGGEPREILRIDRRNAIYHEVGLAWSPDGGSILFASGDAGRSSDGRIEVRRVPVHGGPAVPIGLAMNGIRHLSFSHDGRSLVFAAGNQVYHEVWVMENLPGHVWTASR